MTLTAIIFDMDGLMVDTEPLSRRAWEQVIGPFGARLTDEVYGRMIGRRSPEAGQLLLDSVNIPLSVEELVEQKTAVFNQTLAQGVPVMPGLMELHAEIARRGLPWAVATSSPRHHARLILAQLGLLERCGAIAGGDEVTHGKPAPDIYLLAAERLGVPPQQCLALEDSAPGCQSAASAGMTVVAVSASLTPGSFPCANHIYPNLNRVAQSLDILLQE
ncbi:MAG: HAD family phosphatase [Ardenticatenaceae bacterium]|nr:HAD family phosphatase [Ardenticatenaceae bacterium]MCB9444634.1 HAD family phosphatase [Ardenticatenaceae bacterium]